MSLTPYLLREFLEKNNWLRIGRNVFDKNIGGKVFRLKFGSTGKNCVLAIFNSAIPPSAPPTRAIKKKYGAERLEPLARGHVDDMDIISGKLVGFVPLTECYMHKFPDATFQFIGSTKWERGKIKTKSPIKEETLEKKRAAALKAAAATRGKPSAPRRFRGGSKKEIIKLCPDKHGKAIRDRIKALREAKETE